jgi:hypothetical protein
MRKNTVLVCSAIIFMVSCAQKDVFRTPVKQTERPTIYPEEMDAESRSLVAQIQQTMTFEQVAKIVPIWRNDLKIVEHGGIWYKAPVGSNWIIRLRFENPDKNPVVLKRKLNLPPLIRQRLLGEEEVAVPDR